jgi:hypothetical protein
VSETSPHWAALSSSFASDLLTDWVPDSIGAADVFGALRSGVLPPKEPLRAAHLLVTMATRSSLVPVIDVASRARLHSITDDALAAYKPDANVFSYRSLGSTYRPAYRARIDRLRSLASDSRYPLVLAADVARFTASVPLSTILRQQWITPALADELTNLRAAAGRCLLPGHHWANRIGSAVLGRVDTALRSAFGSRWVRWADDFHVFVADSAEAERVRSLLLEELRDLDLTLSEEKTRLMSVSDLLSDRARDVAGDPAQVWLRGVTNSDVRALRYALPRLAAGHNPVALDDLNRIIAEIPYVLPRAVYYLDQFVDTPDGTAIAVELLQRENAPEAIGRLLALTARHQALLAAVPDHVLQIAEASDVPALRALAWRAARATGTASSPPTERLAAWVRSGGQLEQRLPNLETLL